MPIPIGADRLGVELCGASGTLDKGIKRAHVYHVPKGNRAASGLFDRTPGADHWDDANALASEALAAGRPLTDKAHKAEVKDLKSAAGEATMAVDRNGLPAPRGDGWGDLAPQTEPTASPDARLGAELASIGGDSDTGMPMAAGSAALFELRGEFLSKSRRGRVMPVRARSR
ncbi:hypothetical protein BFF78_05250 [Streptomyces fodineus]|uniref:Uncharacterized protein n=1 Tax=Streptomyces fodineus TaxID=1904616 RepID=A0A1D7Y5B9_9ACTN|nr:hypothetical protein [Streptomyces fodineus]AOR30539.1 hypothetical protein BFF78_05250 [Streptomyces fodineus]